MKKILILSCCVLLSASYGLAQSASGNATRAEAPPKATVPGSSGEQAVASAAHETITIPAGTHIVMTLVSPLHTTSARAGSGAYLETLFPVVVNDRVVVPAKTRVQGLVRAEQRPGRVKGRAQLQLHLTTLIYPNNHTVSIAGAVESLPGSAKNRVKDAEGTLEPVDQIDRDVYTVAGHTFSGATIGVLAHGAKGAAWGAGIGAGLGIATTLFTRGDEIRLPVGTQVEMVLQRPVTLEERRLE